jgi:hypothetical protein
MLKEIEKIVSDLITKIAAPDKLIKLNEEYLSYRFYWYLKKDKAREHKQSKNIIFIIPDEYAEDSLSGTEIPIDFAPKLTSFLERKISNMDKESSHTVGQTPPEEKWVFF